MYGNKIKRYKELCLAGRPYNFFFRTGATDLSTRSPWLTCSLSYVICIRKQLQFLVLSARMNILCIEPIPCKTLFWYLQTNTYTVYGINYMYYNFYVKLKYIYKTHNCSSSFYILFSFGEWVWDCIGNYKRSLCLKQIKTDNFFYYGIPFSPQKI